ncbi:unnamed protein product [Notodromas monacha]|uniref:C2H2-type domain-containing protein n=1 Tax=Notodromas monacha TaxID=399045 RepID=A0A7R9BUG0_9CRUS|nr:unnamed protein product [Notodromas monacha]CAG0921983.1 unnamed protein product [Notodromas monacha]
MEGNCEFLTKDWLRDVFETNGVYGTGEIVKFDAFEVSPGCEMGEGFVCAIFACHAVIVDKQDNSKTWDLIVKTHTTNPAMKKEIEETGMHEREISFYQHVVPALESLTTEPLPIPRMVSIGVDENRSIVLQDLRKMGLVKIPWDRGRTCRESVGNLFGEFGSSTRATDCSASEERVFFERAVPIHTECWYDAQAIRRLQIRWNALEEYLLKDASGVSEINEGAAVYEKLKKFDSIGEANWRHSFWLPLQTICHMDIYNRNLFFQPSDNPKNEGDEEGMHVKKCIVFDWQLVESMLPQDDLALMFLLNTAIEEAELQNSLIFYWKLFCKHLADLQVNIETLGDFTLEGFVESFGESLIRMMRVWIGCVHNMLNNEPSDNRKREVLSEIMVNQVPASRNDAICYICGKDAARKLSVHSVLKSSRDLTVKDFLLSLSIPFGCAIDLDENRGFTCGRCSDIIEKAFSFKRKFERQCNELKKRLDSGLEGVTYDFGDDFQKLNLSDFPESLGEPKVEENLDELVQDELELKSSLGETVGSNSASQSINLDRFSMSSIADSVDDVSVSKERKKARKKQKKARKFSCIACGKFSTSTASKFKKHFRSAHPGVKELRCVKCGRGTWREWMGKKHVCSGVNSLDDVNLASCLRPTKTVKTRVVYSQVESQSNPVEFDGILSGSYVETIRSEERTERYFLKAKSKMNYNRPNRVASQRSPVNCLVCGVLCSKTRNRSIGAALKRGEQLLGMFLVNTGILVAEDVCDFGCLCASCMAKASVGSWYEDMFNKTVESLKQLKRAAAGRAKQQDDGSVIFKDGVEMIEVSSGLVKEELMDESLDLKISEDAAALEFVDSIVGSEEFDLLTGVDAESPDNSLLHSLETDVLSSDILDDSLCSANFSIPFTLEEPAAAANTEPVSNVLQNIWPCPACDQKFSKAEYEDKTYQKHMFSHWAEVVPAPKANQIVSLESPERAESVVKTKPRRIKQRKCPQCSHVSNYSSSLRYHMKTAHAESSAYSCEHCEDTFRSESAKNTHTLKVHLKTSMYQCSHCDKEFFSASGYKCHLKSLEENVEMRICDQCGVTVPAYKLKRHVLNKHAAKRVYRCEHCENVKYSHKRLIRNHYASVHGIGQVQPRPEVPRVCNICGKSSNRRECFVAHMFEAHGVTLPHLKEFTCQICGKKFHNKNSYKRHESAHNQKKYLCQICPYASAYPSNLNNHIARMHKNSSDASASTTS